MNEAWVDDSPPQPEELPALMADVAYEHEMLGIAISRIKLLAMRLQRARLVRNEQAEGQLGLERNAWVEVLLVHLRNLTNFYVSKPRKDDVVAHHYVPGWTSLDGAEDLEWLLRMSRSLNKRVAHITAYRRRVPNDLDSELVEDIHHHMLGVFNRWWSQLAHEQRSWFQLAEDGLVQ